MTGITGELPSAGVIPIPPKEGIPQGRGIGMIGEAQDMMGGGQEYRPMIEVPGRIYLYQNDLSKK